MTAIASSQYTTYCLPAIAVILLPCDAMDKRSLCRHAVSVRVCLSVTFVSCAKTNKNIIKIFSPRVATPFLFLRTKRDDDIPTGTPLTGASNAGVVG